ncbi:MAG: tRNA (N(6)-L-threonylcarbamoyladenosine(37)-C(2))-methylthiotransferase MtaB [Candidatus Magnetoovum sp. WYHC-5]|nr:tRNA (N(6)-L-threonylcarbamoyladenosine(37)-C(2))-methylthiotransferase MtaB [Candidatus Magnetoovum sp. WYHC-5]
MRYCILTLGCKVNQAESTYIENILRDKSYEKVRLEESPDICIINTCSVTGKSDYQSRQLIRRALRASLQVYVTGCFIESGVCDIDSWQNQGVQIVRNANKEEFFVNLPDAVKPLNTINEGRSRAIVKIQDGCNSCCSYCIIPLTRGASVSKSPEKILEEVKALEASGFHEVVLTGIHVGYYGEGTFNLHWLIRQILQNTKTIRLRLTSLEVNELNDEMIELFKENRLCKHAHIPLQSGDNEILLRMNRKYTVENYKEAILKIHKSIENISIGADVITGFPGEKESHFINTYNFIKELPLTYLHVFPYAKRKNTPAAAFSMQVDEKVKKERSKKLTELSIKLKGQFIASQIGKTLHGVVESFNGEYYQATTDNYLKAMFKTDNMVTYMPRNAVNLYVLDYKGQVLITRAVKDSVASMPLS